MITLTVLQAICPSCPRDRLATFVEPLVAAAAVAELNTRPRVAAFLAQAAFESRELQRLEEDLYYTSAERIVEIFRRFDRNANGAAEPLELEFARGYVRNPERLANAVYAGRLGNGDEASGDGWRFRGRGIFQLTGRENYRRCSIAIAGDADALLSRPELVSEPRYAALSAAWFWVDNRLSRWADIGDFETLTRRINGGTHGLAQRVAYWKRATGALA